MPKKAGFKAGFFYLSTRILYFFTAFFFAAGLTVFETGGAGAVTGTITFSGFGAAGLATAFGAAALAAGFAFGKSACFAGVFTSVAEAVSLGAAGRSTFAPLVIFLASFFDSFSTSISLWIPCFSNWAAILFIYLLKRSWIAFLATLAGDCCFSFFMAIIWPQKYVILI